MRGPLVAAPAQPAFAMLDPMSDITLIILAGGLGSRYGGDKQVAAVGPAGETLLEYTLHDALASGIARAIAVVRPAVAERVRQVLDRVPGLDHALVDQPAHRAKPWGTAHALACAAAAARGPVAVVNADDWYGPGAPARLARMLDGGSQACLVAHRLAATLSPHGAVNRGVCEVADGRLRSIREATGLLPDGPDARTAAGRLAGDTPVSLNLWGFGTGFLPFLQREVDGFLAAHAGDPDGEIGIPDVVAAWVATGRPVDVDVCAEPWCGLTHAADRPQVVHRLAAATAEGAYASPLWKQSP